MKIKELLPQILESESKTGTEKLNYLRRKEEFDLVGGIFGEDQSYMMGKTQNALWFKTNDDLYYYKQSRKPFPSDFEYFGMMIENDEEYNINSGNPVSDFKTAEIVKVYERDREEDSIKSYTFLVNGNNYLLLEYFNSVKGASKTLGISLIPSLLTSTLLRNLDFNKIPTDVIPKNPGGTRKPMQICVGRSVKCLYQFSEDGEYTRDFKFKDQFVDRIFSEIVNLDFDYYDIVKFSDDCLKTVEENVEKISGEECIDK